MNLPKERDFQYILKEDTYVVWLAGANRFLQLKEPAFFVFEAWANGQEPESIAVGCVARYDLPLEEAIRFTNEIISETEKLVQFHRKETKALSSLPRTLVPSYSRSFAPSSVITCRINAKTIRFIYFDTELETLFRPLFRQFETEVKVEVEVEKGNKIDFFLVNRDYAFQVGGQEPQIFGANDIEHFQGAVLMEVLNLLHGKTRDDWMGVFHASAVSDGKEALLFLAASGSGKSTLAALMAAHGYQMVSDDFVPVALKTPEVYPLPTAISVKKNAIPFLKNYFSALANEEEEAAEDAEGEVFMPLPEGSFASSPVKAKAIVFVQYDPVADFRLVPESNLTAMNNLLKQSWIPDNPAAAERFLNWYFSLPVYSLVYSDGEQVVRELRIRF